MNKFYKAIQNVSGDARALSRAQVLDSGGSIVTIYADSSGTRFTDATGANVNYCEADTTGMVEFYWTAATGQVLQILDSTGTLERAISDFANNYSVPEAAANVDTVLGVTASDGDLGTFTGSTITDNVAVKPALQELETAVETKTTAATLADTGGAALVSTIQLGTGATARTVEAKLREVVSVTDFGAAGDGVTNDLTALTNAVGAFPTGGVAYFPNGEYITSASLDVTGSVSLIGEDGGMTSINPSSATASDNTVTVVGSATSSHELQRVEYLMLGDRATGARTGLDGLLLLTTATGQFLPKFHIHHMNIGSGSGWAIRHLHTSPDVQGGMYGATIQDSLLRGGIRLDGSGDSNNIARNIIALGNIGVHASLSVGASLLAIVENNITNSGGAIRITGGSRYRIIGNNIENLTAGAAVSNDSAVISIDGTSEVLVGGVIKENLISAFADTTATHLVKLQNCRGTLVQDNVFLSGAAGVVTDIEIGSTCQDVRIGPNSHNRAGGELVIVDNGIGTMGVRKPLPTLQNSWEVYPDGYGLPTYERCITTGDVILSGQIRNGTATAGTLLFTLPAGYRPTRIERLQVYSTVGSNAVDVYPDGTVLTVNVGTAIVSFNGARFNVNNSANSISPE